MIRISKEYNSSAGIDYFSFTENGEIRRANENHPACPCCLKNTIDSPYIFIIHKLKEAGLLHISYPIVCCECFVNFAIGEHY